MAYPTGVVTRPVDFGPAFDLLTGDAVGLEVEIRPSKDRMVFEGAPAVGAVRKWTADDGIEHTVSLPITDQEGWSDGIGGLIDVSDGKQTHYYTGSGTFLDDAGLPLSGFKIGPFALPEQDGSPVDIDNLIPVTTTGGATIAIPDWWTPQLIEIRAVAEGAEAAVEGKADLDEDGKLTEEQVPDRLSESALSARYVRFVDQDGEPLPLGSVATIHVNTVSGDIDDITFEGV